MTMIEVINLVEDIRPLNLSHSQPVRFLQELEGKIELEIHQKKEWEKTETLSVPAPYDRVYWLYLLCILDMLYGEEKNYLREKAAFEEALADYAYYYRTQVAQK